jgi:hypothetical protein
MARLFMRTFSIAFSAFASAFFVFFKFAFERRNLLFEFRGDLACRAGVIFTGSLSSVRIVGVFHSREQHRRAIDRVDSGT